MGWLESFSPSQLVVTHSDWRNEFDDVLIRTLELTLAEAPWLLFGKRSMFCKYWCVPLRLSVRSPEPTACDEVQTHTLRSNSRARFVAGVSTWLYSSLDKPGLLRGAKSLPWNSALRNAVRLHRSEVE